MKKLFFTLFLLVATIFANAQQITNADFEVIDKKIVITYNITGAKKGQEFNVKLWYSQNGGSFSPIINNLSGDIGIITATRDGNITNQKITWNALGAYDKIDARLQFDIRASVTDPVPANFVLVQGGTFQMGSNDGDEEPVHSVTVSSFYISKYEVTVSEFKKFIDATNYQTDADKAGKSYVYDGGWIYKNGVNWKCDVAGNRRPTSDYNHPVIHVSWNDATEYCKWAGGRLPTEAEWEYAAGGGVKTYGHTSQRWAGTNSESSLGNYAWYSSNSGSKTHPVGQKSPNSLGIYDMSGNVWEWCNDWYDSNYYSISPTNNPTGASSGTYRVIRGGSWNYHAASCRVAYRYYGAPSNSYSDIGFRIARND